jgi:hypothetical protein
MEEMMKNHKFTFVLLAAAVLFAGFVLAETTPQKETFTAFAVNTGMARGPAASMVQITIDKWSTEAEQQEMLNTLKTKGEMALLDVLQKMPAVGTIRLPNTIGYDLHYAYQVPDENGDGGRRIYIATNRPLRFWEVTTQPRSFYYPFTLIEIHLNKDNKGEGKMSVATKITLSKNGKVIELEDYAPIPVMLQDVRMVK